jgi:hypothetical protein
VILISARASEAWDSRSVLRLAILALVLAPAIARADEPTDDGGANSGEHAPIENRVNVRLGKSSIDTDGRPSICVDVRVWWKFSVETCGTGQAIIHDDPGQEMMHVRANYMIAGRSLWKGTLNARGGLGFAELQVGPDDPGFSFGHAAKNGNSTAGPEAAFSAQWLLPLYKKIDFVMTATAGLAYFAGAPELSATKTEVQGFASLEAGIGW